MADRAGGLIAPSRGKRFALAGAVAVPLAAGLLLPFAARYGQAPAVGLALASMEAALFLLFAWIQYDRRALGVPRSAAFNFALANFMLVAAPVYFVRHRAPGRRWRPLLGLLAAIVAWNLLLVGGLVAGSTAVFLLHGPS